MLPLFVLPKGSRLAIAGSTGSGKSTIARRYLARSPYHWLIFNPKGSAAYNRLRPKRIENIKVSNILKSLEQEKYTSLVFPPRWDWRAQDDLLLEVIENFTDFGICIDELYNIHNEGRTGPGVSFLLTRGRELNQSFIGLTQRPVFVSKFVFSEADAILEFSLRFEDDRKKMREYTGSDRALDRMYRHDFMYFSLSDDEVRICRQ